MLLHKGSASRTFFDEVTHGACRKPRFELGSVDVLLDLVEINMGISMLPNPCGATKMQEGTIVMYRYRYSGANTRHCACAFSLGSSIWKGLQDLRPC